MTMRRLKIVSRTPEDAFDIQARTFLSARYLPETQARQLAKVLRLAFLEGFRRGKEVGEGKTDASERH